MQIDWITVIAQVVNFLVLVWILRWLLYGPITRAMEAREARIKAQFAEAERREARAKEEAERLAIERADLAARQEDVLETARDSAREIRTTLEAEARDEVEHARAAWLGQLRRDQDVFLADLREVAAGHVEEVARRALGDLASVDLEDAIVQTFLTTLKTPDPEIQSKLAAAAEATGGSAVVESAFSLSEPNRDRLTEAARQMTRPDLPVAFQHEPSLLAGIRLRVGGQTVQWSLDAYLDDLEDETRSYLEGLEANPDQRAAE